jgi:P27 family predicted phage terminase small subunit
MGRRGPAPTPTAVKVRRGETRPSHLNLTEPQPRLGAMPAPAELSTEAKVIWRRVVRDAPKGQIVPLDGFVLAMFCEAYVRWQRASAAYGDSIGVLKGRGRGEQATLWVKNPLHQIVRDNAAEVRLLARELGLSPAARAGLHIAGEAGVRGGIEDTIGPSPRLRAVAGGRVDE